MMEGYMTKEKKKQSWLKAQLLQLLKYVVEEFHLITGSGPLFGPSGVDNFKISTVFSNKIL